MTPTNSNWWEFTYHNIQCYSSVTTQERVEHASWIERRKIPDYMMTSQPDLIATHVYHLHLICPSSQLILTLLTNLTLTLKWKVGGGGDSNHFSILTQWVFVGIYTPTGVKCQIFKRANWKQFEKSLIPLLSTSV